MSDTTWRSTSYLVMIQVLLECKRQGMSAVEIAKKIDSSYPFGERVNRPYKVWLDVRKKIFLIYGLPRKPYKQKIIQSKQLEISTEAEDVNL